MASSFKNEWVYIPNDAQLVFFDKSGKEAYYIILEKVVGSAGVLDWIMQIFHKSWCAPEVIIGLIEAFDYLASNLQAGICSYGNDSGLPLCNPDALKKLKPDFAVFPRYGCGGMATFSRDLREMNSRIRAAENGHPDIHTLKDLVNVSNDEDAAWLKECKRRCLEAGL